MDLIEQDTEDTTVLIIMDIIMERDKLKMRPLPQDQIPMLTPRLMAGVSYFIDKVGFNQCQNYQKISIEREIYEIRTVSAHITHLYHSIDNNRI